MSVQVIGSGTIGGIDEGLVVSGIVTATELDISGDIDVDGQTNLDHTSIVGIVTISAGTNNEGLRITGQHNNCVIFTSPSINGSAGYRLNHHPSTNFLRVDTTDQNGTFTGTVAKFSSAGLDMADNIKLRLGSNQDLTLYHYGNDAYIDNADGDIIFRQGTSEKLRIKSDGNIGMGGNNNPTNVLHIKTAVTNTAVVTIESTATDSYPFLRLKNDAREYQLTCHGGNSDAFVIYDGTSSANRLIIDSNGGVDVVGGYIGRNLSDSFTLNGVNQPHYGFQLNASTSVPVAMSGYFGIAFATEGTERARIERAGHLVPGSNNSYDLGSSSKRWRNVYTTDLQLSNKGKTNDVDNTWGDYTIQEGESDLFLINNRNGKKYKFNLTEVS